MKQQVSRNKAISYIIIIISVLLLLAVWPTKLIRYSVTAKSDEVIAKESDPISVEYNLTQMFEGIGGRLESVDLYVCNDMSGQIITFRLYDQEHKQVYEQFYTVDEDFIAPGFINIPIRYSLVDKNEYSFIVEGLTQELYLAYEDRTTTTSPVNFYMAYGGAEVPEYDVIIRYNVSKPFGTVGVVVWIVALGIVSAVAFFALKRIKDKEVALRTVFRVTINPILVFAAVCVVYVVLIMRLFGPDTKNNLFVTMGFLMLIFVVGCIINFADISIDIEKIKTVDIKKYLQIVSIATVIWYCYEYMNGLYDIFHYYSMCKFLIAFCFVLIFTFSNKEIFNIPNAVWLIAGPIIGYYIAQSHAGEPEAGELYRLYGWLVAVGGFVAVNIVYTLVRFAKGKVCAAKLNLFFVIPFAIFGTGISLLANTRYWVWILVGICVLTMFRLVFWEKREQFSANICLGILLNFYMMVWYSINHRVYYYYQFYRYPMGYHTVTVTAYYVSLIICAALVWLYSKTKEGKKLIDLIPQLFTLGMAGTFLLLTMSRTGFLSTGAVVLLFVIVVTAVSDEEKKRRLFWKTLGIMVVAVLYMFPVTYALVDIGPRIANDPITYEYEYRDFTFTEGMPYSDASYMTIEQFAREFSKKVFGVNLDALASSNDKKTIDIINEIDPFVMKAYASDGQSDLDDEDNDISNGRFDIFRSYIKEWNLWGHDIMGAELPDGEIAVHAHNTFLQVIHDHGLVFGIYFVIFMMYVFVLGIKRAIKYTDGYEMLMPVIMIGFCVASMVEWILHLCNPFGFTLFLSMMPLVLAEKGFDNEKSN